MHWAEWADAVRRRATLSAGVGRPLESKAIPDLFARCFLVGGSRRPAALPRSVAKRQPRRKRTTTDQRPQQERAGIDEILHELELTVGRRPLLLRHFESDSEIVGGSLGAVDDLLDEGVALRVGDKPDRYLFVCPNG